MAIFKLIKNHDLGLFLVLLHLMIKYPILIDFLYKNERWVGLNADNPI